MNEQDRLGWLELGDVTGPTQPQPVLVDVAEANGEPRVVLNELTFAPPPAPLPGSRDAEEHGWLRESWGRDLPSLRGLRERLDREAAYKVDRRVRLRDLALVEDGGQVRIVWPSNGGGADGPWPMTGKAFGQLASRAEVPVTVAEWLAEKHPDLGVESVNRQLAKVLQKEPAKEACVRGKSNGTRFVRAVLSDRYVPLDSDMVIGALDDLFGEQSIEARIGNLSWDGDSLRTAIVFPDTFRDEPGSGGGLYMAAVVRNNEVGGGAVEVSPGLLRDVCTNMAIMGWQAGIEAVHQRHVGRIDERRLKADIAAALKESLRLSAVLADRMEQAAQVEVPDVASVIALLSRSNRLPKAAANAWFAGYREEALTSAASANSVFGVVQGLARAARALRAEPRHETEVLAGKLLGGEKEDLEKVWRRHVARAADLDREEVVQYVGVG